MSWARVDDRFPQHPKVVGLDPAAVGVWTLCLCDARARGDDIVPAALPERYAPGRGSELAAELVSAGLWVADGKAWRIHDLGDYAPADLGEKRSQAGSKGAARRWQSHGKPMANARQIEGKPMATLKQPDGSGSPKPNPKPIPTDPIGSEARAREATQRIGLCWTEAGRAAGFTDYQLTSGYAFVLAEAREALAAGEPFDDIVTAAKRLGKVGRAKSLAVELRQMRAEKTRPKEPGQHLDDWKPPEPDGPPPTPEELAALRPGATTQGEQS